MKITDYKQITELPSDSIFLLNTENGTKTITARELARRLPSLLSSEERLEGINISELNATNELTIGDRIIIGRGGVNNGYALEETTLFKISDLRKQSGIRRCLYRGWNIGNEVSDKQYEGIANGTFVGIFLGDYWLINGVPWRVVDFNYFDTGVPHVVIMPTVSIGSSKFMQDGEYANGGYVSSYVRHTGMNSAKEKIKSSFGEQHILTYRSSMINAVNENGVTGYLSEDVTIELPDARMLGLSQAEKMLGDGKDYLPLAITLFAGQVNKYSGGSGLPLSMMTRSLYTNKNIIVQWYSLATSTNSIYAECALRPVFAIKG